MSNFKADYFIAFENASLIIWSFEKCINYPLETTGNFLLEKMLNLCISKNVRQFWNVQNWSFELYILITRQYGIMFKSCNEEDIITIREDIIDVFENIFMGT